MISELSNENKAWKIKGRISYFWEQLAPKTGEITNLDFIVVDEEVIADLHFFTIILYADIIKICRQLHKTTLQQKKSMLHYLIFNVCTGFYSLTFLTSPTGQIYTFFYT